MNGRKFLLCQTYRIPTYDVTLPLCATKFTLQLKILIDLDKIKKCEREVRERLVVLRSYYKVPKKLTNKR